MEAVHAAQKHQWEEFCETHLSRCSTERELLDRLKELDLYLADRVYFVGHELSKTDVSIYESLHIVMANLGFSDKEAFTNVSRWFNNVQHKVPKGKSRSSIVFVKSPIYHSISL